jgi:hypothetical protein
VSIDAALPEAVAEKLTSLREHARAFVDDNYDPSPAAEATTFGGECTEQEDARLLEKLILREGHGLRQRGRDIVPGVAFQSDLLSPSDAARSVEEGGSEADTVQLIPLPEGVSHRVRNLFLLNLDFRGELEN